MPRARGGPASSACDLRNYGISDAARDVVWPVSSETFLATLGSEMRSREVVWPVSPAGLPGCQGCQEACQVAHSKRVRSLAARVVLPAWCPNSDCLRGPCVSAMLARGIACPRPTGRIPTRSGPWDCMLGFPPGQRPNRGRHAPGSRGDCTRGRVGRHSVAAGPAGPRSGAMRSKQIVGRRVAMQHPRYSADTVWRHIARCGMSCRAFVAPCE